MRKNSPQNQTHKGAEKPTSPRLTLRFQSIKSKDEKNSGGSKANDVSSSQPKYQSYCVTMETRDNYDKKDESSVSSTQNPASGTSASSLGGKPNAFDVVSSSSSSGTATLGPSDPSSATAAATKDHDLAKETTWKNPEGDKFSSNVTSVVAPNVEKADSTEPHGKANGSKVTTDAFDYSSDNEKENNRRKRRKSNDGSAVPVKSSIQPKDLPRKQHNSGGSNHGNELKTVTAAPQVSAQNQSSGGHTSSPKSTKKKGTGNSDTESTQSDAEAEKQAVAAEVSTVSIAVQPAPSANIAQTGQSGSPNSGSNSPHSPKVPPLKIVIGGLSSSNSAGNDSSENRERNKVSSSKTSLPYVVSTAAEDSAQFFTGNNINQDTSGGSLNVSGGQVEETASISSQSSKDRSEPCSSTSSTPCKSKEEERFQRVTRSSQRMQAALATGGTQGESGASSSRNDHSGDSSTDEHNQSSSAPADVQHPRKRKLRTKDSATNSGIDGSQQLLPSSSSSSSSSSSLSSSTGDEVPVVQGPQQLQPLLNCYQMFFNIRKQVDKRRKAMFVVHPKPPQGFKDYLLNRCSYVLEGNAASRISVPTIPPPQTLNPSMKELFIQQEKDRYKLRLQHLIEREKLVLSTEQEILRVHGRAARAMANQTVPLSACSILKDEEIYNSMELEQDKDKNVRSRYNGRLFLSWLQDVDDKWEKIKEMTLLRHHNEAESLHAVQKLDWEWKMKELLMCEVRSTPLIDDIHVPMVHVSDDFELLPT